MTAPNETLRAELTRIWAERAEAAESRLATATELLVQAGDGHTENPQWLAQWRSFLANQPAAPQCGSCRDAKVWSDGLPCPVCQPAAPARTEAEQRVSTSTVEDRAAFDAYLARREVSK